MWASTRSWRGVRPVASGGPSGSSATVFLVAMVATVAILGRAFKHLFEPRVGAIGSNIVRTNVRVEP